MILCALSVCNPYKNIRNQRDEPREDSRKGAYEWCDLHTKLRDTENGLYRANEKLQDADSDMNEERKEFRDAIQGLNDQHLADQEQIRSLEQDVWNTESDRDGYSRQVLQVSRESGELQRDLSKANNQRIVAQAEVQTLEENLSEANAQRDLARTEVQTLQENLSEAKHQRDQAKGQVQTLSVQREPRPGQATSVVTMPKARPKPNHRRTQRQSSLPKTHRKLSLKGSKAAKPRTSSSAGPKPPRNIVGENLSKGRLQAMLAKSDQEIQDLQEQSQTSSVQAGAEAGQMLEENTPEALDLEASITAKDHKINDLEQENRRLTADHGALRTYLEKLSDEHDKCSEHLQTQLAEKDEEIRNLQAEKTTADNDSAETINILRTELEERIEDVADLEEANATLVAEAAPSADTVQRLNILSGELEVSRRAHDQCDENTNRQSSRIGELVTEKEQLEETLRAKNNEIESLQGQVTPLHNDLEELQEAHAGCGERANTKALEITELRNANEELRGTNGLLLRQVDNYTHRTREHEKLQNRNEELRQAGLDLQSSSQREILLLRGQIDHLNQTVHHQQQHVRSLETNCPKCQILREALDEVGKDVEMSDEDTRAEMKREVTETVRAQLRSQVSDDLRRQIRGELEREFQYHYRDVLASNTRRLQEQDRQLVDKDAKLDKAQNASRVNHAACENKEANLQSKIARLRQDAQIAQGNYSRLNDDAKCDREQLKHAQRAIENLSSELEAIKADQRRAQNVNPLQSKLTTCQRELESMKVDRNKARDNCSTYSKQLSSLRKEHKALESEHTALREKSSLGGDSIMDDGRTEERTGVQDEQRKTMSAIQNEIAKLSKELEERKVHDNVQAQAMGNRDAVPGTHLLPVDEHEQEWPEGSFPEDQSSAVQGTKRDGAAALDLLRYEVDVREARDGKRKAVCSAGPAVDRSNGGLRQSSAQDSDDEADGKSSLLVDGGEKSDDELEKGKMFDTKLGSMPASKPWRRFRRRPVRQPTTKPVLGGGAGQKREHDEYSDGEADDEGGDERKRAKITAN